MQETIELGLEKSVNNSSEIRIWSRCEGQVGKEKLAELPRAIGKSTNK
jgi:hypothetical protein